MSFSLFDDETEAVVETQKDMAVPTQSGGQESTRLSQPPAELVEVAEVAVSLPNKLAAEYQKGLDDSIAAVEDLKKSMTAFYGSGFDPFDKGVNSLPSIEKLHFRMHHAIIHHAKETGLAAPGSYKFEEDFDQFLSGKNHYGGIEEHGRVDISGLCHAIYKAYSGSAGANVEHIRVAKELIKSFSLETTQIEHKSGCVVLSSMVYLEKRYSGSSYKIHYNYQEDVFKIIQNLRHVFAHAGVIADLGMMSRQLSDYHFEIFPNKTTLTGYFDDQPVTVKVMKSEFRWKFSDASIAILSDFVAEYGGND